MINNNLFCQLHALMKLGGWHMGMFLQVTDRL